MLNDSFIYWRQEISDIVREKASNPALKLCYSAYNKPLTGDHFKLTSYELMYIFMAVELRIGRRIVLSGSQKYSFYTINSIAKLICEHYDSVKLCSHNPSPLR